VHELASLVVDDALGRPVGDLLDIPDAVAAAREALVALTSSDAAANRLIERAQKIGAVVAAEERELGTILPTPLAAGMHAVARLPVTPSASALLKLLDRPPVRRLLRAQVIETLAAFGRRAASPVADSPIGRGIGGISKRAMKIASGPGALSRVANAVSGEVERQVEKRAADFADTAVEGILEGLVEQATDALHREDQAAVRVAVVDGLLEMTGADLASLVPGHPSSRVDAVRSALAAWSSHPAFAANLDEAIRTVLAGDVHRPLGDLLADFALRDVVANHAIEAVDRAIAHLVAGAPFERWLTELLDP
jgi:hypothetical protein